jgi:hypothetical protein
MRLNLPGKPLGMVRVGHRARCCGNGGIGGRLTQGVGDRKATEPRAVAK